MYSIHLKNFRESSNETKLRKERDLELFREDREVLKNHAKAVNEGRRHEFVQNVLSKNNKVCVILNNCYSLPQIKITNLYRHLELQKS